MSVTSVSPDCEHWPELAALDEALRLTRLLDEILDISRLEAGTVEVALAPVDPDAAIDGALDTVSGTMRTLGVKVHRQPLAPDLLVQANEDRLRQVLINLLGNAVKFTDEGEITIAVKLAQPADDGVTLRFEVPERTSVEVEVFDLRGRRVRRLIGGESREAGMHTVTWRGDDDGGRALASGVYFYEVQVAGDRRLGKLTLVR